MTWCSVPLVFLLCPQQIMLLAHHRWAQLKISGSVIRLPSWLSRKESAYSVGDLSLIPGLGTSPGEGNSCPLQYSGLENSMDWIVHGVAKSWMRLSHFHNWLKTSDECQKQDLSRDAKNAILTLGSTLTTTPLYDLLLLIWPFSLPCSSLMVWDPWDQACRSSSLIYCARHSIWHTLGPWLMYAEWMSCFVKNFSPCGCTKGRQLSSSQGGFSNVYI